MDEFLKEMAPPLAAMLLSIGFVYFTAFRSHMERNGEDRTLTYILATAYSIATFGVLLAGLVQWF